MQHHEYYNNEKVAVFFYHLHLDDVVGKMSEFLKIFFIGFNYLITHLTTLVKNSHDW